MVYKYLLGVGLRVSVFDRFKHYYMPLDRSRYSSSQYYFRVVASAAATSTITCMITYPLDLINTRLSCDMTKRGEQRYYSSAFQCLNRTNIDEGGFRKSLFKGLDVAIGAGFLRICLTLPIMDSLRSQMHSQNESTLPPFLKDFNKKLGVSFLCSMTVSALIYPLDTVKRNLQLNGARNYSTVYSSSLDCFKHIMSQQGGLRAMYRGVHVFALREMLTAFAQLGLYDLIV